MSTKWILLDAVVGGILKQAALVAIAFWGLPQLGYSLPLWAVIPIALVLAVQSGFSCVIAVSVHKRKPVTGPQMMIGKQCVAITVLNPGGYVRLDAELWQAVSIDGVVEAGTIVQVVAVNGIVLTVKGKPS